MSRISYIVNRRWSQGDGDREVRKEERLNRITENRELRTEYREKKGRLNWKARYWHQLRVIEIGVVLEWGVDMNKNPFQYVPRLWPNIDPSPPERAKQSPNPSRKRNGEYRYVQRSPTSPCPNGVGVVATFSGRYLFGWLWFERSTSPFLDVGEGATRCAISCDAGSGFVWELGMMGWW